MFFEQSYAQWSTHLLAWGLIETMLSKWQLMTVDRPLPSETSKAANVTIGVAGSWMQQVSIAEFSRLSPKRIQENLESGLVQSRKWVIRWQGIVTVAVFSQEYDAVSGRSA